MDDGDSRLAVAHANSRRRVIAARPVREIEWEWEARWASCGKHVGVGHATFESEAECF